MKYFKVHNAFKKTMFQYTRMESETMNLNKTVSFEEECSYRWGYVIVQKPDNTDIVDFKDELKSDSENGYFNSDDHEMEEAHCDDLCSTDWDDLENCTQEELEEKYEDNTDWSNWGYGPTDNHYEINGPMTVTDVTSEYQTV
jgi:hypothetical protein|tara:strand:- start:118 stop:543 length:426 start_codon:yes stop_codon:yes gene_type:complete